MKLVKFFLMLLGTILLIVCIAATAAYVTGKFSASGYIGAGPQHQGQFGFNIWRCEATENNSVCHGYTINETGVARTLSRGGRPHN